MDYFEQTREQVMQDWLEHADSAKIDAHPIWHLLWGGVASLALIGLVAAIAWVAK